MGACGDGVWVPGALEQMRAPCDDCFSKGSSNWLVNLRVPNTKESF